LPYLKTRARKRARALARNFKITIGFYKTLVTFSGTGTFTGKGLIRYRKVCSPLLNQFISAISKINQQTAIAQRILIIFLYYFIND
jgi:hypothetical protein